MVLKKRSSVSAEEEEPKKRRKEEKVEEPSDRKSSRKNKEYVVKVKDEQLSDEEEEEEEEEEEVDEEEELQFDPEHPEQREDEQPQWPQTDLNELFNRIDALIPANDTLCFTTRAERIDWEEVAFKNYSPAECKSVWSEVQKKIRKYRLLKEVIADARLWVRKPWTNFYGASKHNQHPDMPRRPLTQYMVYYLEKKDKVAAQHPDLDMTNLSKVIARMYKGLPEHKKEKYVRKAAELREEYVEKLRVFYEKHPEYKDTVKRGPKEIRSQSQFPLKKPLTPVQMFVADRLEKMKDDPNFDKTAVTENAKQQWKSLSDKKKVVWINWSLEKESKYLESLKLYMAEHPEYQPPPYTSVLNKTEQTLKDRAAGKPAKPPNSSYSMYSRIMLAKCPDLRELVPKLRMKEISVRWKQMSEEEKEEYAKKVKYEQDRYKLEYATYLESLNEEDRQEELLKTQPSKKKKPEVEVQPKEVNNGKKANKSKKSSKKGDSVKKFERQYFPGEPHQPPVNAYDLFVESFVSDTKLSATDAPRFWEMLPSSDKSKFQRKLKELKEKYIKDYKKFLKSLDEEQVAKYNDLQKRNKQREAAAEAQKAQNSDDEDDDSDSSSSEDEARPAINNVSNQNDDSDSDENAETEKKSESSSDSSSSGSGSSSSSSSSDDSDSSSDDSDEEKKTNENNAKKANSDSDSSDDE